MNQWIIVMAGATDVVNDKARRLWLVALPGVVVAVFAGFLLWRLLPPKPFEKADKLLRRSNAATQYASVLCQPDLSTSEKRSISTDVAAGLRQINTDGSTSTETIRQSINRSLSEQGQLVLDDRIRGCMVAQAAWHIASQGGAIREVGPAPSWPPAEAGKGSGADSRGNVGKPVVIPKPADDGAEGFVYFEERNGRATEDGRFTPIDGAALPAYGALKVGQVLEALGTARLRRGPGRSYQIVANLSGQDCVRVLSSPENAIRVGNATSGGHLHVRQVTCPVPPAART